MEAAMEDFESLKRRLALTVDHRLDLDGVAMILTPRWFFVGIMKRVCEEAGRAAASRAYYGSGWDGAYAWGRRQIEKGLSGRRIMEQYLGSMTSRGWGRFEIVALDLDRGEGRFRFFDSAVAREWGPAEDAACLWAPGALAGALQVILDDRGGAPRLRGVEEKCLAAGAPFCEFRVAPEGG
jgi:predicted hydrocarbon binding protein